MIKQGLRLRHVKTSSQSMEVHIHGRHTCSLELRHFLEEQAECGNREEAISRGAVVRLPVCLARRPGQEEVAS